MMDPVIFVPGTLMLWVGQVTSQQNLKKKKV